MVTHRPCPPPLQDLVEKVVVLRRAVEQARRGGAAPTASGVLLEEMMGQYAGLLASQGSLATALAYLSGSTNQVGPARRPEVQPRGLAQDLLALSLCDCKVVFGIKSVRLVTHSNQI